MLLVDFPASAGEASGRAALSRCCFEVTIQARFELNNSWVNPPQDGVDHITSHGFIAEWTLDGFYAYSEAGPRHTPSLHSIGPAPRVAALVEDHGVHSRQSDCFENYSTSGSLDEHRGWLIGSRSLIRLTPGVLRVSAGPPMSGHFSRCGGTFEDDVQSNDPAAKDGMQGPWSYTGRSPSRPAFRHSRSVVVVLGYVNHACCPQHGTPLHETARNANMVESFRWFGQDSFQRTLRAFTRTHPLGHAFTKIP